MCCCWVFLGWFGGAFGVVGVVDVVPVAFDLLGLVCLDCGFGCFALIILLRFCCCLD